MPFDWCLISVFWVSQTSIQRLENNTTCNGRDSWANNFPQGKSMAPLEFKNYFVLWDAFSAWMSLLQKHNCSWETDQALEILVIPFNFQIIHLLFTNLESSRGHSPDVFSSSLYWHNMCHSFLGEFVHWFCEIWRIELDTREISHLSKSSTGTRGWSKPGKN